MSRQSLQGRLRGRRRIVGVTGSVFAAALALSGCSGSVTTKQIGACSPGYTIGQSGYGKVSIQQAGQRRPIAWGVYVASKFKAGTFFVVKVYAGGQKIDGKNQNYEPHGSVNANRAAKYSGAMLEIKGTGQRGRDTLFFDVQCRIA